MRKISKSRQEDGSGKCMSELGVREKRSNDD